MSRRRVKLWTVVALSLAAGALPLVGTAAGTGTEHVRIDVAGGPSGGNPEGGSGRFTLRGVRLRDAGSQSYSFTFADAGTTAAGQPHARLRGTVYLTGKKGGLVIAVTGTSFSLSGDGAASGRDVWTGSWRVGSGTGAYRGTTGNGAFVGIAGPSARIALRLDGRTG